MNITAASIAGGISQRFGTWDKERFWSIEDWRKHLIKSRGKSKWNVVPQRVINSIAYMDLSFPAREALTQAYNIAGRYPVTVTGDTRKRKRTDYLFKDFCLPLNLLRAVGFGCDRTAIRAIRELLWKGFIERVEERKGQATVYRMSDGYRKYQPLS